MKAISTLAMGLMASLWVGCHDGGGSGSSGDGEAAGGGDATGTASDTSSSATGEAGGGGTGGEAGASCEVTASPAFGAVEVDVTADVRVTFSVPVDLELAAQSVQLVRQSDGEIISFEPEPSGDRTLVLRPTDSLAFFEHYELFVQDLPRLDGEGVCPSEGFAFATRAPFPAERPLRPAPIHGFAVVGEVGLAVSRTFRGLQIYDLADPSAPVLLRELQTASAPLGIVVSQGRAYVPAGADGILVFDLEEPDQPSLLAVVGTPGIASEVVPLQRGDSTFLAVADGPAGLRILDVTDPPAASTVAWLHPSGAVQTNVVAVDAVGDLLAVAQVDEGFALLDVSDLAAPSVLLNRLSEPGPESFGASRRIMDVALDGTSLYVSLLSMGVQAFDLSVPTSPAYLGHALGPQGLCAETCPDEIANFTRSQFGVFAASTMTGAARFRIDGSQVTSAGTFAAPGRINSVTIAGATLFLGTDRGLAVFSADGSGTEAPLYLETNGWGTVHDVSVRGDYAYVASGSRGVETYPVGGSFGAPLALEPTLGVEKDVGVYSVNPVGELLLLGDARAGLAVLDVSSAQSPEIIGTLEGADTLTSMVIGDDVVHACNGNLSFWVIDISDPTAPSRVQVPVAGGCNGIARRGDMLFVGGARGLGVHDLVSDHPSLITEVRLPAQDQILDLALAGDFLYASSFDPDFEAEEGAFQRLVVFDVSDPRAPQLVFESTDLRGASQLLVQGDKLFVGGRAHGVHIFGLGDPTTPRLEGTIPMSGSSTGMALAGTDRRTLHVALTGAGVGLAELGPLR